MPRFLLIDHSITGVGGHHYEYAVRMLDAAAGEGYTPVLATNRRFRPEGAIPWAVHAVYRYGFWFSLDYGSDSGLLRSLREAWSGLRLRMLFSRPGLFFTLFWENRYRPADLLRRAEVAPTGFLVGLLSVAVLYVFSLLAPIVAFFRAILPARAYFGRLRREFRRLLGSLWYYGKQPLRPSRRVLLWLSAIRKARAFDDDTRRLAALVDLAPGDIVFIPTLGEPEMLGLLRTFARVPRTRNASWHLLFRRNIFAGYDAEYAREDEDVRPLRNAFRHFTTRLRGQSVYFYTDTDQLTVQYNRLGVARFSTLPIPVGSEYRRRARARRPDRARHVVFAGDARAEKGYRWLPDLVLTLAGRGGAAADLTYTFQSNLSDPASEPASLVARTQLEALRSDRVRLLLDPLESDEYRDLVLSGDLILVPYDRINYYARSSGIFVEALVAGIPVVVPGGTWMALEMDAAVVQAHRRAREACEIVSSRVGREVPWRLDRDAPRPRRPTRRPPRPADDDQLLLAGNAARRARLVVPPGSSHLLVSFQQVNETPGLFVDVTLTGTNPAGIPLRRAGAVVGGHGPGAAASALFALDPGATEVRVRLQTAYSLSPLILDDVRVEFLRATRPLPLSAVGMMYRDPGDLAACVAEIVRHYPHYRDTAGAFAVEWADFHNPTRLVQELRRQADGTVTLPTAAPETAAPNAPSAAASA